MSARWWEARRVLVTGGAGFIGSNLVPALLRCGARVRVVDNLERGNPQHLGDALRNVELIRGDLRVAEICKRSMAGIDVVFHLASKVGGIGYYQDKAGEVVLQNVLIDANLLDAARSAGVERYVYASSAHVYPIELQQTPDARALREEDAIPANPGLSYGWAKLVGEKQIEYLVADGTGPRAAILRLVGAYGGNQDLALATGSAIPVFITRAILYPERSPFVIWGTGRETRSYCYIDDVVSGMIAAAEALEAWPLVGPLNLGCEGRITIEGLARAIIDISKKPIELVKDESKATAIWGQAVDCSRARAALDGWAPQVPLVEGLRRSYAGIERRVRRATEGLAIA